MADRARSHRPRRSCRIMPRRTRHRGRSCRSNLSLRGARARQRTQGVRQICVMCHEVPQLKERFRLGSAGQLRRISTLQSDRIVHHRYRYPRICGSLERVWTREGRRPPRVIRDRVEPTASPAMFAVPPKAEAGRAVACAPARAECLTVGTALTRLCPPYEFSASPRRPAIPQTATARHRGWI